eukprot:m.39327 g.39327  ORF g.39327 m.39327 type:complete len:111 (-) comp45540_c0_seq2:66-398(-)
MNAYNALTRGIIDRNSSSLHVLALAYEDLVDAPLQVLSKVFSFTGAALTPTIAMRVLEQMEQQHGPTQTRRTERDKLLNDDLKEAALSLPACAAAHHLHSLVVSTDLLQE